MQQRVTNHQLLSVADAETATGISRWTWRRWACPRAPSFWT